MKKPTPRRIFPLALSDEDRATAKRKALKQDGGNVTTYITRLIREDGAKGGKKK